MIYKTFTAHHISPTSTAGDSCQFTNPHAFYGNFPGEYTMSVLPQFYSYIFSQRESLEILVRGRDFLFFRWPSCHPILAIHRIYRLHIHFIIYMHWSHLHTGDLYREQEKPEYVQIHKDEWLVYCMETSMQLPPPLFLACPLSMPVPLLQAEFQFMPHTHKSVTMDTHSTPTLAIIHPCIKISQTPKYNSWGDKKQNTQKPHYSVQSIPNSNGLLSITYYIML